MRLAFAWMEQTERTLQSPGEECAPLSEAGMQEWNAHYLSLETLGLDPTREATVGDRGGREEQLAARSWAWSWKQAVPVNRRQDLRSKKGSKGWTHSIRSKPALFWRPGARPRKLSLGVILSLFLRICMQMLGQCSSDCILIDFWSERVTVSIHTLMQSYFYFTDFKNKHQLQHV